MSGMPIHLNHHSRWSDSHNLRIPVGYWSIPLTSADTNYSTSVSPYIPGAWPFIQRAISWANQHSIHVIIDLHGAPGSQNGFDNSGQRIQNPLWASTPANVGRTLDILKFIAKNLGSTVDVIELLNEPAGFEGTSFANVVRQFWSDGYNAVRAAAGGAVKVMIGDAFLGVSVGIAIYLVRLHLTHRYQNWQNFMTYPSAQGVLMDYVSDTIFVF